MNDLRQKLQNYQESDWKKDQNHRDREFELEKQVKELQAQIDQVQNDKSKNSSEYKKLLQILEAKEEQIGKRAKKEDKMKQDIKKAMRDIQKYEKRVRDQKKYSKELEDKLIEQDKKIKGLLKEKKNFELTSQIESEVLSNVLAGDMDFRPRV